MKHKNELIALLVFFFASLIFTYPVSKNINNWGIHDWDQHLMYNGVPRSTIIDFKQFPLWNPYYCGGSTMLANPQSSFLSPMFIFILIFGEVIGLKLLIFAYLLIGLFGMFLLSRHLKVSLLSSYLSSFLFMLSGIYAMRMSIGHTIWMQTALMPYVFLFYLKSLEKARYAVLSALFMAFILFGGGIYLLAFSAFLLIIYSILATIKEWKASKTKHLRNTVFIFLLFILFSSIKLIPMMEFVSEHSFVKIDVQHNSFKNILDALTLRDIESRMGYMYDYNINGYGVAWGWHEYHAYIGILPLILLLIGSVFLFRKEWPLILAAAILFFIAWGEDSIINIWGILKQLPFVSNLHGPSRFLAVFVFLSSLIIGKFTSMLEGKKIFFILKNKKINIFKAILILIILIIFTDLFLVNSQLLKRSFAIEPLKIEKREFTQITGNREKSQYAAFLSNRGIVNCFERVKPALKAIPKYDMESVAAYTNYIGEAYMLEDNKTQKIAYFSPNKVKAKAGEKGTLVLNQNYVKGWKVKGKEIQNVNGLIGAKTEKDEEVTFYYLPNSFIFGWVISIVSIVLVGLFFIGHK